MYQGCSNPEIKSQSDHLPSVLATSNQTASHHRPTTTTASSIFSFTTIHQNCQSESIYRYVPRSVSISNKGTRTLPKPTAQPQPRGVRITILQLRFLLWIQDDSCQPRQLRCSKANREHPLWVSQTNKSNKSNNQLPGSFALVDCLIVSSRWRAF